MSFILVLTMLFSSAFTVGAQVPLTIGTSTPTDVEQAFETPTDLVAFGDPNGDNAIDAKDALLVLQTTVCKHHLTFWQELAADVNRDGLVNALDALEMLRHSVKKPSAIEPLEITLQTVWGDTYTANTSQGKAWQSQLATVAVSYGIKTRVEPIAAESAADEFVKAVMAGKVMTDVAEVSLAMSRNIAKKKAAANLMDSKTLKKSLCKSGATQSVTFNGQVYGFSSWAKNTNVMGILYNKELIKTYAPNVDIQALYKTKQWNFEAFEALAKRCTVDTDEDGKTDLYGVIANTNLMGMAVSANAGGTALMKNNRVEATFLNDEGIYALEWCKALYKTDKSWRYRADVKACAEEFAQGKAAMFASYVYFAQPVSQTADFEMGFVPMPIGPSQTEYINNVYDAYVYVVPRTNVKRLDQIGFWLNGIADTWPLLNAANRQELASWGIDEDGQEAFVNFQRSSQPEFSTGAFSQTVANLYESLATNVWSENKLAILRRVAQQELDEYYGVFYQ